MESQRVRKGPPRFRVYAFLACAWFLFSVLPGSARARQQTASPATSSGSLPGAPLPDARLADARLPKAALPDAPLPNLTRADSAQSTQIIEGSAIVFGDVLDVSGSSVAGAEVSVIHEDGTRSETVLSAANGEFRFADVVPGSYLVTVNAEGFAPFTSAQFRVAAQQLYDVPDLALSIATENTAVIVRPTEVVAAEQIRAAEQQRLLGVIPNFYTSYRDDAAPLTAGQKFRFAVRGTFDPVSILGVGVGAGIEQATDAFPGYGQGAAGYGKRFAAKFADGRDSDFLTHAVFPSLFHQDPRYYYQGSGSIRSRVLHAVGSAFFTRTDAGLTAPNYSYLLGNFSAAALSNLYYPRASRGAGLVFTTAAVGLGGRLAGNILREFSKRVTTNALGDGSR